VLLALQRLVHVLGPGSRALYPLLLPLLGYATDPRQPESLQLVRWLDGAVVLVGTKVLERHCCLLSFVVCHCQQMDISTLLLWFTPGRSAVHGTSSHVWFCYGPFNNCAECQLILIRILAAILYDLAF
jgi:hypothetical protein